MPSLRTFVLVGSALAVTAPASAQYAITVTPAAFWGASDAVLGVSGYVIEDFEDSVLAPGLRGGWLTEAGDVVPAPTIPFTFAPVTEDPNGDAFDLGVWDGSRALVNTRTNQSYVYSDVANWGDIVLEFTTPVTSVGFSLQQNEFDVGLFVNGASIGSVLSRTGISPDGQRYAYIRIDAAPGGEITTLRLANGRSSFYDGFVIDHVAFAPVPEPSTVALMCVGIAALAAASCRRRVRGITSSPP